MASKNTNDLLKELTSTSDISVFLDNNQENFKKAPISDLLLELFEKSGLTKAALAKKAATSEVYLYQIFSGGRTPSRSRTLCLCIGMSCTLEETQKLLRESGQAQLYPKNQRDAVIIYGMTNGMTLSEINDKLYTEGEDTLY